MARDLSLVALVASFVLFVFGFLIGTSPHAAQAVAWGLSALLVLAAAIAGARATLLEHFPPKE